MYLMFITTRAGTRSQHAGATSWRSCLDPDNLCNWKSVSGLCGKADVICGDVMQPDLVRKAMEEVGVVALPYHR